MTKLAMILGLCAFISAPAFADDAAKEGAAAPATTTEAAPAAPAMKHKGKKMKHAHKKGAEADAPKAE